MKRSLRSWLWRVPIEQEVVTFAGAGVLVLLTAVAASAAPAWRAARVDPVLMFRAD